MGTVMTHDRAQVYQRRRAAAGAIIATGLTTLGALIGWNLHETTDVRAKYIADLPVCKAVGE